MSNRNTGTRVQEAHWATGEYGYCALPDWYFDSPGQVDLIFERIEGFPSHSLVAANKEKNPLSQLAEEPRREHDMDIHPSVNETRGAAPKKNLRTYYSSVLQDAQVFHRLEAPW